MLCSNWMFLYKTLRCRWSAWARLSGRLCERLWFFGSLRSCWWARSSSGTGCSQTRWRRSGSPYRFFPEQSRRFGQVFLWKFPVLAWTSVGSSVVLTCVSSNKIDVESLMWAQLDERNFAPRVVHCQLKLRTWKAFAVPKDPEVWWNFLTDENSHFCDVSLELAFSICVSAQF